MDNLVFMFGGYDGDSIFGGTWRLDLNMMQWRKLPYDMPEPVYFHSAVKVDDGKIYTFGGVANITENSRTNSMYSAYMKIPSLRAMCWDAVKFYSRNLDVNDSCKLFSEGIPGDLIKDLLQPDMAG